MNTKISDMFSPINIRKLRLRHLGLLMAAATTLLLTTSCTTATYGDNFVAAPQTQNEYRFKIYVGGFQFAPPETQAEKRIKEFMAGKPYTSYKIISKRYNFIPSYYEFTVVFSK